MATHWEDGWLAAGVASCLPPATQCHANMHTHTYTFPAATSLQRLPSNKVQPHPFVLTRRCTGACCGCCPQEGRAAAALPRPQGGRCSCRCRSRQSTRCHRCRRTRGMAAAPSADRNQNGRQVCVPSCHGGGHQQGSMGRPRHKPTPAPRASAPAHRYRSALPACLREANAQRRHAGRSDRAAHDHFLQDRRVGHCSAGKRAAAGGGGVPALLAAARLGRARTCGCSNIHVELRMGGCWAQAGATAVVLESLAIAGGLAGLGQRPCTRNATMPAPWRPSAGGAGRSTSTAAAHAAQLAAGSSRDNTRKSIDVQGRGAGTASSTHHPL